MNNLFKLTFTPLVDDVDSINKYKVNVKYFNKHVIGAKFDMRDNRGLGFVVFFRKDFIEVDSHHRIGYGGETYAFDSEPNGNCVIEERYIKSYVESIEKVKPQLEKLCLEKQKSEDCKKKAFENWQQKKPIEYSF